VKHVDGSELFGLKCAIVYGIGEFPTNEKGLQLNGTLEILFCANDDNTILGGNKHTCCERYERGALMVASNGVGLVANAEVKAGNFENRGG